MTYRLEYTPAAARHIEKLPRNVQARILNRIESLARTPRPPGAVKLAGHEAYRIRVGDCRIIYGIPDDRLVVLIVQVGHRRDV